MYVHPECLWFGYFQAFVAYTRFIHRRSRSVYMVSRWYYAYTCFNPLSTRRGTAETRYWLAVHNTLNTAWLTTKDKRNEKEKKNRGIRKVRETRVDVEGAG